MTITLYHPVGGESPAPGVARSARNERSLADLFTEPFDVLAVATANVDPANVDWPSAADTLGGPPGAVFAAVLGTHPDDAVALAWSILPPALARLAVDPTRGGIVAVPQGTIRAADTDAHPWQLLFHVDADHIAFIRGAGQGGDQSFPAITPSRPGDVPDWLRSRFEEQPPTVRAGLLQMHDHLDDSHTIAQSAGHADGDYWHAIMHRREPDASNSKYWWRRVGDHPVFPRLAAAAEPFAESLGLASGDWDPYAFVDASERARTGRTPESVVAVRRLQWLEMLLLLDHCAE